MDLRGTCGVCRKRESGRVEEDAARIGTKTTVALRLIECGDEYGFGGEWCAVLVGSM